MEKTITVYVHLLEEGTPTLRPTEAIDHGNGEYTLLATPKYDPEDEIWEFVPGTKVSIKQIETDDNKKVWMAIENI